MFVVISGQVAQPVVSRRANRLGWSARVSGLPLCTAPSAFWNVKRPLVRRTTQIAWLSAVAGEVIPGLTGSLLALRKCFCESKRRYLPRSVAWKWNGSAASTDPASAAYDEPERVTQ